MQEGFLLQSPLKSFIVSPPPQPHISPQKKKKKWI